jgi:hypothetical protein
MEKTMPEKHSFHHMPLRKLGFEYVPAVPVDIPRTADTLVRLGIKTKTKQYEQTLQGLSRTYTIRERSPAPTCAGHAAAAWGGESDG